MTEQAHEFRDIGSHPVAGIGLPHFVCYEYCPRCGTAKRSEIIMADGAWQIHRTPAYFSPHGTWYVREEPPCRGD